MIQLIVSDTTTLIILEKQHRLSLLCDLFDQVLIPETVYQELLAGLNNCEDVLDSSCMVIKSAKPSKRFSNLLILLDAGKAEAIELALQQQCPLIIDEKKGRKIAQQMGLKITGLAGLLILAVQKDVLLVDDAKILLEQAIQDGYRLSLSLYQQVLERLGS